ncbi:tetratricopeptide repeat protein [Limisphaera sp. 4302-co]|uniref:tetratricopeptide repeat protein n=1 Tax=Limisphaera sp. 4302-co TaxID=3400417 RepID=UPI003C218689
MTRLLPIICLGLVSALVAEEATPDSLLDGVVLFEKAYQSWDAKAFAKAEVVLRLTAASTSTNRAGALYWLGVTEFHHMLCLRTGGSPRADEKAVAERMDAAIHTFKALLELAPTHPEGHALLGTLYGMKIEGNLFRAIRYWPDVQKHQKAALRHGRENPRVHYLLGVGLFHIAGNHREFEEARATLQRAAELFDRERQQPRQGWEPRWGHGDCLAFLGQVEERLGRHTEAEKAFRRALEVHPGHSLALDGLRRRDVNR